jgi:hypothetical protein
MENRNTKIAVSKLVLISIYLVLALIGLVGTWYFNFEFFTLNTDVSYLEAWFANPASSSAAVDIIVVALMGSVFMLVEGWRLEFKWVWILIPMSFFIALAFTFPLFLAIREIRLSQLQRFAAVV